MFNIIGNIAGLLKPMSEAFFNERRKRARIKVEKLKLKKKRLLEEPATTKRVNKIFKINEKITELERWLIQE